MAPVIDGGGSYGPRGINEASLIGEASHIPQTMYRAKLTAYASKSAPRDTASYAKWVSTLHRTSFWGGS